MIAAMMARDNHCEVNNTYHAEIYGIAQTFEQYFTVFPKFLPMSELPAVNCPAVSWGCADGRMQIKNNSNVERESDNEQIYNILGTYTMTEKNTLQNLHKLRGK